MSALDSIASWGERWQVPNAAAAVFTGDGVLAVFGDQDHRFYLASVTKLLTSYAVLAAVEEEAIGLSDPAGPPGATVEHLFSHTSGYGFESDAPAITRPGGKRIYSNRGIEELADHVATATGIDFGTYLSEAVLTPLGLASTQLYGSPAHEAISTARDLAVFGQELLTPKFLDSSTLASAVAVHFPGLPGILPGLGRFDPLDWGLGFERNFGRPGHWAGQLISGSAFGHFGAAGTFLWLDPSTGLGCVCLADQRFDDWSRHAWPTLTDAVLTEYAARH